MKRQAKARRKFRRLGVFHAYIVVCADGTYYTGSTGDLQKRVELHNKGRGAKYLRGKLPVRVVFAREYRYYKTVLRAERRIKKMPRLQKEKLVRQYQGIKTGLRKKDRHISTVK